MDSQFTSSFVLQHVRLVVTESYFKFSRGGAHILQVAFGTSGQINNIVKAHITYQHNHATLFVRYRERSAFENSKIQEHMNCI